MVECKSVLCTITRQSEDNPTVILTRLLKEQEVPLLTVSDPRTPEAVAILAGSNEAKEIFHKFYSQPELRSIIGAAGGRLWEPLLDRCVWGGNSDPEDIKNRIIALHYQRLSSYWQRDASSPVLAALGLRNIRTTLLQRGLVDVKPLSTEEMEQLIAQVVERELTPQAIKIPVLV